MGAEIRNGSDRRMRLAGLATRGAGPGHPDTPVREGRQHPPAMKQLVVGMRVDGEDCGTIGHGVSVAT